MGEAMIGDEIDDAILEAMLAIDVARDYAFRALRCSNVEQRNAALDAAMKALEEAWRECFAVDEKLSPLVETERNRRAADAARAKESTDTTDWATFDFEGRRT